jgi:NADH-quinone oxidoreductase subunit J
MPGSPVVFYILAVVAVASALGMLLSRNAIYSALFLALNFATVAMLYLILGAPFIALSQITVYAGSIMVLFLFVIMLLGAESLPTGDGDLRWQPLLAIPLVLILAADFAVNLVRRSGELVQVVTPQAGFGSPAAIGETLFTQYMLPFEVTAVILLSATVGAIMLAKPDRPARGQTRHGRARTNAPRNVNGVTGLEILSGKKGGGVGNQPVKDEPAQKDLAAEQPVEETSAGNGSTHEPVADRRD